MYKLYDGILTNTDDLHQTFAVTRNGYGVRNFEVQIKNVSLHFTASNHKEAVELAEERYPTATIGYVTDFENLHKVIGHCEISGAPIFENDEYLTGKTTDGEGLMWLKIHDGAMNKMRDEDFNTIIDEYQVDGTGEELVDILNALCDYHNKSNADKIEPVNVSPGAPGRIEILKEAIKAAYTRLDEMGKSVAFNHPLFQD